MTTELTQHDFWSRLNGVTAGMLTVEGARPIPMSHYTDEDNSALWFITANGTELDEHLRDGPLTSRFVVACDHGKLYAHATGTARLSEDKEKLSEVWSFVADAWFDGKTDPDVRLVRFDLDTVEAWATEGKAAFIYEIAKAHVTDEKPEVGEHGVLRFAA